MDLVGINFSDFEIVDLRVLILVVLQLLVSFIPKFVTILTLVGTIFSENEAISSFR